MASTAPPLPREVVAVDDKMTSCPDAPAVLIEAIRRHWAIENSVHWVRDVVFREDDARSRDHVATRSFAVLRKRAFNLLQQGKHQPGSLWARRRNAGGNEDYMSQRSTCARENGAATFQA